MKRLLKLFGVVMLAGLFLAGCQEDDNTDNGPGNGGGDGTSGVPAEIVIARTFPALLANGVDEVEVKATVVDGQGRGLGNVGVFFTTNRGTIEPF
ncbi:MAG TPA: Ig-like domain-containing protein, partial [Candidatus Eisenbacteria bacterium]